MKVSQHLYFDVRILRFTARIADEERVFLVSEELEFRSGETDGEPTFIWRDLDGDVDELYEFVAANTNEPTRAFFETCMYRAMYERKYRKSADDTADADLQEFIRQSVLFSCVRLTRADRRCFGAWCLSRCRY